MTEFGWLFSSLSTDACSWWCVVVMFCCSQFNIIIHFTMTDRVQCCHAMSYAARTIRVVGTSLPAQTPHSQRQQNVSITSCFITVMEALTPRCVCVWNGILACVGLFHKCACMYDPLLRRQHLYVHNVQSMEQACVTALESKVAVLHRLSSTTYVYFMTRFGGKLQS